MCTIVLDDSLPAEAMQLNAVKNRSEVVDDALREYIARHKQRRMLLLAGQELIDPDYDARTMRSGMNDGAGRLNGVD